jgi:hypothetical protein
MVTEAAKVVVQSDMELVRYSLAGDEITEDRAKIEDIEIKFIKLVNISLFKRMFKKH